MAFHISSTVLDTALNYLANNCDEIVVLNAYTTTFSDTQSLVSAGGNRIAAVGSLTSGDYTIGAGDTDGREIAAAAQSSVSVGTTTAADATHLAWVDTTNSAVLYVTEISPTRTGLISGDSIDIPAHEYTLRAATAE